MNLYVYSLSEILRVWSMSWWKLRMSFIGIDYAWGVWNIAGIRTDFPVADKSDNLKVWGDEFDPRSATIEGKPDK